MKIKTPARAPKIWISGLLACAALCGRDLERAIRFLRKLRALSLSCTVPVPTPTSRAHQCIISVIAQAIATTMTRITSQNLIGIRASLRCVTSTASACESAGNEERGENDDDGDAADGDPLDRGRRRQDWRWHGRIGRPPYARQNGV
jgi:hypothetical protein